MGSAGFRGKAVESQSSGEEWVLSRSLERCLRVLCKLNPSCAKEILLPRSFQEGIVVIQVFFYTSRTINVKMTRPRQGQPLCARWNVGRFSDG